MALAKVPIVPQWNLPSGCAATPDGGFLYIGSKTINYISKINDNAPPLMKVFHIRQPIQSLAVDPAWPADGSSQPKLFAVLAQDSCVQIWDFEKGCAVSAHKGHISRLSIEGNGPRTFDKVLLSYMSNRNVLSLSSFELVIYCVASNSFCRRPTFISSRNQQITVLRCSPYNENIFAVGTSRGLVLVCDLHQMRILYTLRGHEASISSLSWTMVKKQTPTKTINQTPDKGVQPMRNTPNKSMVNALASNDDIFDIYDYDYLENEFGAPSKEEKLKDDDAEFVGIEKPLDSATTTKFDFIEACQNLREEIDALKQNDNNKEDNEVTLEDCQKVERQANLSSSCDSTEGSLELISRSSDDDNDVDVDGAGTKILDSLKNNSIAETQRFVHKAEVHSTQLQEQEPERITDPQIQMLADEAKETTMLEKEANLEVKDDHNAMDSKLEKGCDILLASGASDATFSVWNTETGAACDQLRARGSAKYGKNANIEIAWFNSNSFLTTNRTGDLTMWKMLPNEDSTARYKFKEEKCDFLQRSTMAFSVSPDNAIIWTISSYREISCENILTKQVVAKYCCASTSISAMRECPDDMNKIALGCSDRRIGIIDISQLSATNVSIENYTARIDSSVLSIVWSPDSKKLAYGTVEGTIGIVNVENSKLQPFTYHPFCGKPIYSMDWKENYIFVVCNEKLGVYDDSMNNKDAHMLQGIQSVSAISVRNEYLFVGTQRGHLQVYRRKAQATLLFDLIQDLEIAPRYITDIAWSPIASESLAVTSMANKINILNFNRASAVVTQVRKIEIKNPKTANACVKWSNRNKNKFMTCGFDGAVRIWDLDSGADDEKFLRQYHCPMTCGLFLPSDENIVICAGKSTSVEFFNMIVEKSEEYSQAKWLRLNANTLEHVQWAIKMKSQGEGKLSTTAEKRRQRRGKGKDYEEDAEHAGLAHSVPAKVDSNRLYELPANGSNKEELLNMMDNLQISNPYKVEEISKTEQIATHKCGTTCGSSIFMKKPATLLYLTTKEINKDALEKLTYVLTREPTDKSIIIAKLFNRKCDAKELLEEELRNHQHSETKGIGSLFMPQLQANLKDEILKCIQNKQLSEWHVSLAPSISYNFWQKCCQALAEQLMEQGYALQAATYMTAIHNQTEAIQMLIENNYFKEALLIGRVYLQPDDPQLHTITDKWISYLDTTGNLTGAALICALSCQMNRAHEILSKVRNMQPDVEKALQLLKINKNFNNVNC